MSGARTYGELHLEGGRWLLDKIEPHVSIRLKQIFPRIPKSAVPPYGMADNPQTCADIDWFRQRYPLAMSDAARERLTGGRMLFEREQAEIGRILMPDYRPPDYAGFRPGKAPRVYQSQAVELLRRRRSLLCGDEVGLGKTILAANAMLLPGALPAAVVLEPHIQDQWEEKILEFTSLSVHQIRTTKPYDLPAADVYLWRYSNLGGWVNVLSELRFGLAVWDEIQALRNGTGTVRGSASARLGDASEMRLGLTATPIMNYGGDIWQVMRFIDPDALGEYWDFAREWCTPLGNGKLKVSNPQALGTYLREQGAFLRRTRREVGRELPPVNRIVEPIDCDEKAVKSAEEMARVLAVRATTGSFVERGQAARELDAMMRHATGVAKAKPVALFVRMLLEAGESVLLVGWHRDCYDIWLRELADHKPVMYTGSETAAQKERAKQAVLSGQSRCMLLSLRSGVGLDGLQECFDIVVFGELDWSAGIHHQCIGRVDRDREGEQRQVTAYFLVSEEGSDPPMMEVLGLKASQAAHIVDPTLGVQAAHSDTTHLRKLVERYLEAKGSRPPEVGGPGTADPAEPPPSHPAPGSAPAQLSMFQGA